MPPLAMVQTEVMVRGGSGRLARTPTRDDDPLKTVKEPRGRRMRGKEFLGGVQRVHFPYGLLAPAFWPTPAPGVQWPQTSFLKAWGVRALPGSGVKHPSDFSPVGKSAERPIVLLVPRFPRNPPKPPQKCKAFTPCHCFWGSRPSEPQAPARKTGSISPCFECPKVGPGRGGSGDGVGRDLPTLKKPTEPPDLSPRRLPASNEKPLKPTRAGCL